MNVQTRFTPQNSCVVLRRASTKAVKNCDIWNLERFIFNVYNGSQGIIRCASRKSLVVERHRQRLGTAGNYLIACVHILHLTVRSSSSHHAEVIRPICDFRQPCILKTAGRRSKGRNICASGGKYLVYKLRVFWPLMFKVILMSFGAYSSLG